MDKTRLGDRMKEFERAPLPERFKGNKPVMARLDGKGFSKLLKKAIKPYDKYFGETMRYVTLRLLVNTGARIAYTQSDEISLMWLNRKENSQCYHGGRPQKMISDLAGKCTLSANRKCCRFGDMYFDCRLWALPDKKEAIKYFIWRQRDCIRNSINGAARTHFSHKSLLNKKSAEKVEMLQSLNTDFYKDYPNAFKYGTFIRPEIKEACLGEMDLSSLPEKHEARTNPEKTFKRTEYIYHTFNFIKSEDKEAFLFGGLDE